MGAGTQRWWKSLEKKLARTAFRALVEDQLKTAGRYSAAMVEEAAESLANNEVSDPAIRITNADPWEPQDD